MRITNAMMINNTLNNINKNKGQMDKLNTQLSTQKKIQRPSEDPITAIRSLRYRSTLSEVEQYLDRNIPDARSWLEITDDALENTESLVEDIVYYCQQGSNGINDTANRATIVETLSQYRNQIYADANADVAGRTIFTGYKTDSTLTYTEDEPLTSFSITQNLTAEEIDRFSMVTNSVDVTGINATNIPVSVAGYNTPNYESVYRLRLGYSDLETTNISIDIGGVAVNPADIQTRLSTASNAYTPGADEICYVYDTGELIFGSNMYNSAVTGNTIDVTYTKTGFLKNELRPENYFDCTDITDPLNTVSYTKATQDINYTVNFNQTLKVNTEGKEVFTHDMTRDIDDLSEAVSNVKDIEDKIVKLQELLETQTSGTAQYNSLVSLIELSNVELDYAKENMQQMFEKTITKFQEHQERVSLKKSDNGARSKRLDLNEERLKSQATSVTKLKTANEDVDLTAVAVEISEAENIYDASLAAAAKVVQKTLLDFI